MHYVIRIKRGVQKQVRAQKRTSNKRMRKLGPRCQTRCLLLFYVCPLYLSLFTVIMVFILVLSLNVSILYLIIQGRCFTNKRIIYIFFCFRNQDKLFFHIYNLIKYPTEFSALIYRFQNLILSYF